MIKEKETDYIFSKISKLYHDADKVKATDLYVMWSQNREVGVDVEYVNNHYDYKKVGSNINTLYDMAAELVSINRQHRKR